MMSAVELARNVIRDRGFVSAVELVAIVVEAVHKKECADVTLNYFLEMICNLEGYHRIEYANASTQEFRLKDLFYYNPFRENQNAEV